MADDNPLAETVTLTLGGTAYTGWTEVTIDRAIDQLAGRFELGLTHRDTTDAPEFPLKAGAAVRLSVGDELLITGWLDTLSPEIGPDGRTVRIAGRDKAADLIDCSAVASPGSWSGTPILTIAQELAKPFGITVVADADLGAPLRKFALQPGETVQAALERMARYRGVLLVSRRDGSVAFVRPKGGAPVARIAEGVNLMGGSATHDVSERFSTYIAKGQSSGSDAVSGRAAAGPKGEAADPAVPRYRPLIVMGEEQSDLASLKTRAEWERTVRAGRAQEGTLTVPGWRQADGRLFDFDRTVTVAAPSLFLDADLLVKSVSLKQDDREGTRAELGIAPPEAFSQLPVPEEREASKVVKKGKGKPVAKKADPKAPVRTPAR